MKFASKTLFSLGMVAGCLSAQQRSNINIPVTNWSAPEKFSVGSQQSTSHPLGGARDGATTSAVSTAAAGATAPLTFVAMTPCRLVDTRTGAGFIGAFGPPALAANTVRTIPIPSQAAC